jgi:site-specific recombinase XerD
VADSCELSKRIGVHFENSRDKAIVVTFLLTGARLREIVQLDKVDIDLHQSTVRLHRKGGEINILPLADSAKTEIKAYLKQRRRRSRTRALFISCRNRRISRGTVWYLVKKYFKKCRIRTHSMGPPRFAAYLCDTAFPTGAVALRGVGVRATVFVSPRYLINPFSL